jgi:hypothetical protein
MWHENDRIGNQIANALAMEIITGVFRSSEDACRAALELHRVRFDGDRVSLILPGESKRKIRSIRTSDMEQPGGIGGVFGGVFGGALGLVSGFELGIATSALIPGVGPVLAIGAAGAALFGIGGAVGGAAIGSAVDVQTTEGLPADEVFFYEDALRQGNSVVVTMARDHDDAEWARHFFARSGAESVDAARKAWWIGLRDAEKEHYRVLGENFEESEEQYRTGFEAALQRNLRGKSFVESMDYLKAGYPSIWQSRAFRNGFDRGQVYLRDLENRLKPQ